MKKVLMGTLLMFAVSFSIAQKAGKKNSDDKKAEREKKNLLPDESFDAMIIQDITYAIFGESTPVSGLKIDITKPEGTISSVFQPKKAKHILWGFDFKGGLTDKTFSLFKGLTTVNSAFELKPALHFIPARNSAKYKTKYEALIRAKNSLVDDDISKVNDSLKMAVRLYNYHFENLDKLIDTMTLPADDQYSDRQKRILAHFIRKSYNLKDSDLPDDAKVPQMLAKARQVEIVGVDIDTSTYKDFIYENYRAFKTKEKSIEDLHVSKHIANASEAWTKKKFWWYTLSPIIRAEKVNQFYTKYKGLDSNYFKSGYELHWGANLYINHYIVYPNKLAHYLRMGITVSRSNNLASLSSFNYDTRSPLFSNPGSATEKTKTGIAYYNTELKNGLITQLTGEYYLLPLKFPIPGAYVSGTLSTSNIYKLTDVVGREDDDVIFSLEGGLVFNINSREKDKEKSLFSLLAYFKCEDVTDSRRTSISTGEEETKDKFQERNYSIGVKVGIPINLPQRSK